MPNEISLDPSLYIFLVWVFTLFMMYKISRSYYIVVFALSIVQLLILGQLYQYIPSTIREVSLVAGVIFLIYGVYKSYSGFGD